EQAPGRADQRMQWHRARMPHPAATRAGRSRSVLCEGAWRLAGPLWRRVVGPDAQAHVGQPGHLPAVATVERDTPQRTLAALGRRFAAARIDGVMATPAG